MGTELNNRLLTFAKCLEFQKGSMAKADSNVFSYFLAWRYP